MRRYKFIVVLFLLVSVVALGKNKNYDMDREDIEKYWVKLEKRADGLYKGFDLDIEVSTGLYSLEESDEDGDRYKGEIKFNVPIYSKTEKREKKEKKRAFLDEGAKVLKILEINLTRLGILKEKKLMLQTILKDEGVRSIEAYHKVREDIAVVRAEIDEGVRNLENMLR